MKKFLLRLILILSSSPCFSQYSTLSANQWVDSVFSTLSDQQKLAQLMVVRLSAIDPVSKKIIFFDKEVADLVRQYNVGGICLFQGGPVTQAQLINYLQSIAKTPLLFCIDGENGLGMRMDSVLPLPRQMMLGALQDPDLIYQYGRIVGEQCRRMGIQVNFAPVADINNNPDNPVINDRSFGENKLVVARDAVQYMKGLQDAGIMACAKHFPGHGDVSTDSHKELPVILKSRKQLDTLELYPFKELFRAAVASVMVGHLSIPSLDDAEHTPSSLSKPIVTKLLRKELKFQGISFTDALEMQAVTKYFPSGEASVQSLIAGNDMLCLPGDIAGSLKLIVEAIHKRKLKWKDLNARIKKVLLAKYQYGLASWQPVDTAHLVADLNKDAEEIRRRVAENAFTLLRNDSNLNLPLVVRPNKQIAYVGIGLNNDNEMAQRIRTDLKAHVYYFDNSLDSIQANNLAQLLNGRYDVIVVGIHNYNRYPANNFGINPSSIYLWQKLQEGGKAMTLVFGNPYAIKNFSTAKVLIACYEDNEITQGAAVDWLEAKFPARGKLPVSIQPGFHSGDGIIISNSTIPQAPAASVGLDENVLLGIDSICRKAIALQAAPGCVVLVARNGKLVYNKSFGYMTYDKKEPVHPETLYDLASVTKICATTMAVMKLYDEGKLDLQQTLGYYLPWVRGSNKENLKIWDIMLHQAGLKAFIPFYQETISKGKEGYPMMGIYSTRQDQSHTFRVAENLYLRNDWEDTIYNRILQSDVQPAGKYLYSDNDFIFMGKVVEAISGQSLDQYVMKTYYEPLGMLTTGFKPRERFSPDRVAPTEQELVFRRQLLRADVHDPGAAMFGGVSGHAGLFSDAYDLAILEQMLLNGGTLNGKQYLKKETIAFFTAYHSDSSRRGIGFDKPERDNMNSKDPYPCLSASPETFGHTGFTGTCVWVDPKYNLIYIFLSNRVNPTESKVLGNLSIRGHIMETIYRAMKPVSNTND